MATTPRRCWVVLPGGGVKGAWQAGFMRGYFCRPDAPRIDHVYGTSVGAVLSPLVAARRLDLLEDLTLSIKTATDVFEPWDFVEEHIPMIPLFCHLGIYRRVSLIDRILGIARDHLSDEQLEDAFSRCHVVSWDVKNKRETWFTGPDLPFGMRASSALCLAVPPIEGQGGIFTDGGVAELLPLARLQKDLDALSPAEREGLVVLIIDCDPREIQPLADIPRNPVLFALELVSDGSLLLAHCETLDWIHTSPVPVAYIKPSRAFFDNAMDIHPDKIRVAFDDGRSTGEGFEMPDRPPVIPEGL